MNRIFPSPFGVLWDLDGTIVDTGDFHYQSWQMALPEFGISFSAEKFPRTFGMTNEGVLAVFTDGQANPALVDAVAERIGMMPQQCVVMEDALAGVGAARNAGMRSIAVATTNSAEALQEADIVVERLDRLGEDSFQRLLA